MGKPTPAQARFLKTIAEYPGSTAGKWGSDARLSDPEGVRDRDRLPLNLKTMMVCLRLGWLDSAKSRTQLDWGGGLRTVYRLNDRGRAAIADLPPEAFINPRRVTAHTVKGEAGRVLDALASRHRWPEWVFMPEVSLPVPVPQGSYRPAHNKSHRVDALAVSIYESSGYARVGYEVKVTRADFQTEMCRPEKTQASAMWCSEFYFACPKGVLEPKDVPDPYGLVIINPRGSTRRVKRSTIESRPPTWGAVAYLIHRIVDETQETTNE